MKIAKKLLKALMWLALAIAGLIIVLYLVVLGINWRDQPPSPASIRLMKLFADKAPVADQDNAYVYLMGFSVEPAQDPRARGMQRIAWAREQLENSRDAFNLPGKDHDFKAQRPGELQALIKTCNTVDAPCLKALDSGEKTMVAWLASEQWLLARYRALLAHPAWSETLPFEVNTPLPPYQNAAEGQKLLLAQAWQLAGRGDADGVKKLLAEDSRFWRHKLVDADSLIAKMVAANALKRHFTWGNLALRRLPPALMAQGVPAQWMTPLSDAERAMLRVLAGEWTVWTSIFKQAKEKGSMALYMSDSPAMAERLFGPLLKPMLQVQDASNRQAERLMASEAMLQVPYAQYPAAIERVRAMWDKDADSLPLERLYNPVGDILLAIGSDELSLYAVRVSDLEGLRRLTLVATELRSQGVSSGQLAQKLAEASARNPYTEEPFVWDDSTKALVFTGVEKGERGRHALVY